LFTKHDYFASVFLSCDSSKNKTKWKSENIFYISLVIQSALANHISRRKGTDDAFRTVLQACKPFKPSFKTTDNCNLTPYNRLVEFRVRSF